jgi:hypothetical protein
MEQLSVKPDPNVAIDPVDSDDVVELLHQPPSEGSRRCMIYRERCDGSVAHGE